MNVRIELAPIRKIKIRFLTELEKLFIPDNSMREDGRLPYLSRAKEISRLQTEPI